MALQGEASNNNIEDHRTTKKGESPHAETIPPSPQFTQFTTVHQLTVRIAGKPKVFGAGVVTGHARVHGCRGRTVVQIHHKRAQWYDLTRVQIELPQHQSFQIGVGLGFDLWHGHAFLRRGSRWWLGQQGFHPGDRRHGFLVQSSKLRNAAAVFPALLGAWTERAGMIYRRHVVGTRFFIDSEQGQFVAATCAPEKTKHHDKRKRTKQQPSARNIQPHQPIGHSPKPWCIVWLLFVVNENDSSPIVRRP
jgi:hypothetical protein